MPYHDKVVKFNKCAYFLLPLIGLNTKSYGDDALVECYITKKREIILQLKRDNYSEIKSKKYFIETWNTKDLTWIKYVIPAIYENEFNAFLKGKYSEFSERGYFEVYRSITKEIVEVSEEKTSVSEFMKKYMKPYMQKIHENDHPIMYRLKQGAQEVVLTPNYIAAIAPKGSQQRNALKIAFGIDYGMELNDDMELYEKPDLENEIYQEEKIMPTKNLTVKRELFDKLNPKRNFISSSSREDAAIVVQFTDTNNQSHEFYIAKMDCKRFLSINHLGNYIRSMIRKKLKETGIEYTAICEINPWNMKINVDQYDHHIKNY